MHMQYKDTPMLAVYRGCCVVFIKARRVWCAMVFCIETKQPQAAKTCKKKIEQSVKK